jgi:hypothetical protein
VRERILRFASGPAPRADERHAREGWGFARVPSLATFYENVTFGAFQESDAASGDDVPAYASLTPGSVVWGRVIDNREPSAIKVEILRVVACDAEGVRPSRWRFAPGDEIFGRFSADAAAREGSSRAPSTTPPPVPVSFPRDSHVLAVVLAVTPSLRHVELSARTSDLPGGGDRLFPPYADGAWGTPRPALGPALCRRPPPCPTPADAHADAMRRLPEPILPRLERDCDFQSPHSIAAMQALLGVGDGVDADAKRAREYHLEMLRFDVKRGWSMVSVRRGDSALAKKDLETALKCYEQALELDPNFADGYAGRGAALFRSGKVADAVLDWESTLRLDPEHAKAREYLARARELHPAKCAQSPSIMAGGRTRPSTERDRPPRREVEHRADERAPTRAHAESREGYANGAPPGRAVDGGEGRPRAKVVIVRRASNDPAEREALATVRETGMEARWKRELGLKDDASRRDQRRRNH